MTEVEALQKQLDSAHELIAQRDKVLELTKNPLYRELIVEGFCKTDCAFYTHASGDPTLSEASRQDALNIAQASGHFRRYMSVKIQQGNQAEDSIQRLEAEIEEARREAGVH